METREKTRRVFSTRLVKRRLWRIDGARGVQEIRIVVHIHWITVLVRT
jgi:hypothetical protein